MPRTTVIDDSPYSGGTSAVPWQRPHDPLTCKGCGSSLYGRRETIRRDTSKGIAFVVETFRCRCSRRREIKREVVATG